MVKVQKQKPELNLKDLIVNNKDSEIRISIKNADQEAANKNTKKDNKEVDHNVNWELVI